MTSPSRQANRKQKDRRARRVTALLAVGTAGVIGATFIVLNADDPAAGPAASATTSAVSTSAAPSSAPAPVSTAAPTPVDPVIAALRVRTAYLEQEARAAGYAEFYSLDENVGGLALNVCGTLDGNPTANGVWTAAANLEQGSFAFSNDAAWGFVLLSTVYCPTHQVLVGATIADVTG